MKLSFCKITKCVEGMARLLDLCWWLLSFLLRISQTVDTSTTMFPFTLTTILQIQTHFRFQKHFRLKRILNSKTHNIEGHNSAFCQVESTRYISNGFGCSSIRILVSENKPYTYRYTNTTCNLAKCKLWANNSNLTALYFMPYIAWMLLIFFHDGNISRKKSNVFLYCKPLIRLESRSWAMSKRHKNFALWTLNPCISSAHN